ncbi:glycosyltransferase family 39 protein [Candidatus Daviesbacteria bacterium]|nr:glycosyltransferase family 39 protein [Candidatus Daviesbacteria bacterium]
MLILITAVGAFLRFQEPLIHVHFFDEDVFLHKAQRINANGTTNSCEYGVFEKNHLRCLWENKDVEISKNGYPLLLSFIFKIFGTNEFVAFRFNTLIGILTIVLAYLITKNLWSESAGLLSAIFIAVFPYHIHWSVSISSEIPAILFILSSFLFFIYYSKNKKFHFLTLSFLLIFLASSMRNGEPLLLLPSYGFLLIKYFKEILNNIKNSWMATIQFITTAFFLGVNLLTIILINSKYLNITENLLGENKIFSINYFTRSLDSLVQFHFAAHDFFTLLLLISSAIGLYRLAKKSPRMAFLLGSSTLTIFLLYSFFSFSLANTPSTSRLIMVWMTILILVAGIGLDTIWVKVFKKYRTFGVLSILIALSIYVRLNIDRLSTSRDQNLNKVEQAKLEVEAKNPTCIFVDYIPEQDLFHGYNAIGTSLFERTLKSRDPTLMKQPCIIFFETTLCKTEKNMSCHTILSNNKWEKLEVTNINAYLLKKTLY